MTPVPFRIHWYSIGLVPLINCPVCLGTDRIEPKMWTGPARLAKPGQVGPHFKPIEPGFCGPGRAEFYATPIQSCTWFNHSWEQRFR